MKVDSKTLTTRITAGSKLFLTGCGFKPLEPEVYVGESWIADLAGYIRPTMTELKRNLKIAKLVGEVDDNGDWLLRFMNRYGSLLTGAVEVKVTRADFMKDAERKFGNNVIPPANLAWVAIPKGIIEDKELPYRWGQLIFNEEGTRLIKHRPPFQIYAQHPGDTMDLIAAVGERCYNKWHYRDLRQSMKNSNMRESESRNNWRMTRFLEHILYHLGEEQDYHTRRGSSFSERLLGERMHLTAKQKELCAEIDSLTAPTGDK